MATGDKHGISINGKIVTYAEYKLQPSDLNKSLKQIARERLGDESLFDRILRKRENVPLGQQIWEEIPIKDRIDPNWTLLLPPTPERWKQLAEGLPGDLLARPPAPQEWSALACLGHLLDTERWVFPPRVRAFLTGADFEAFHPETQGTPITAETDPRRLVAEFARLRSSSLELLRNLSDSDLTRQARHSEVGMVTLEEMLNEWAAHDLMHTVQAERALMQPFLAKSGPWRPYFADHDIQGGKA